MNIIAESILLSKGITLDKKQLQISEKLLEIKATLEKSKLFSWRNKYDALYIWGNPGVGKTMLMDAFYAGVNTNKKRVHWHSFLKTVLINQYKPCFKTSKIGNKKHFKMWLDKTKLLCFDEFHIRDAGNATLLSLFIEQAIFQKVTLIITSNYHPNALKTNTFQKHLVEKMIILINNKFKILHLPGNIDYRAKGKEIISFPLFIEKGILSNKEIFEYWTKEKVSFVSNNILIEGRKLTLIAESKNGAWLEFSELCEKNRSYFDYLSYSIKWNIIFISGLSNVCDLTKDSIKRFIWLIDVFYEAKVCLILELPKSKVIWLKDLEKLNYPDLKRCISRLQEMSHKEFSVKKKEPE